MFSLKITKNTVTDGRAVKAGDFIETDSMFLVHIGKAVLGEKPKPKIKKNKTNRIVKELTTRDD